MKLVKQTKLRYKNVISDKTYEVDLVQKLDGQYLVNFRYGRTGKNLKEGTKTSSPVSETKARTIFDKIVAEKVKKGYSKTTAKQSKKGNRDKALLPLADFAHITDSREQHILAHLKLASENQEAQDQMNWSITRVIWRAGELGIQNAIPYLRLLHDKGEDMQSYSALYAAGKLGDQEIAQYYLNVEKPADYIHNLAKAILLNSLEGDDRKRLVESITKEIPTSLAEEVQDESSEIFENILEEYTLVRKSKNFNFLTSLYLLRNDFPKIKTALFRVLRKAPMRPPHFKAIRNIFKLAEFQNDGQFYGVLAYKFENTDAYYSTPYSKDSYLYVRGKSISKWQDEQKKENTALAYSNKTKSYFTKKTKNYINDIIENKNSDFVNAAMGILLSYSREKDFRAASSRTFWKYERRGWKSEQIHFPAYAEKYMLNKILYSNTDKITFHKASNKWRFTGKNKDFGKINKRTEAWPELWDENPKAYIHLLAETNVEPIHIFAHRGLLQHPAYENIKKRIDIKLIMKLIYNNCQPTVNWALGLADEKHDKNNPNKDMTITFLNSENPEVRKMAIKWIKDNLNFYFTNMDTILAMMFHKHEDIRKWINKDLSKIIKNLDTEQKQVLSGRIIVKLLGLSYYSRNKANEYISLLRKHFKTLMKSIGFNVIKDMATHKMLEIREYACELLLNHKTKADDIPRDIFYYFLHSKRNENREAALVLLGKYSDKKLLSIKDELIKYATHNDQLIRKNSLPIIARLTKAHAVFGEYCVHKFVPILLKKDLYEDIQEDLFKLLSVDLNAHLATIERKTIFRLLNSENGKAQMLGTILVDKYIPAESMNVESIVRLGNHEILACRKVCQRMFNEHVGRMRYEREEAIRLMDAKWDDTREFAFEFFRKNFREKDWTPKILVSICDSVRLDVQKFGRELITKFFKEENGTEYLLKLSQHPRIELQLFASNYLEQFASDDLDKIKQLEFYFTTVLSQVNKGRTAKDRVLQFLRKESMKNESVAEMTAKILDRLSLTVAKGDKSDAIELMRDIHEKYPTIEMPIKM